MKKNFKNVKSFEEASKLIKKHYNGIRVVKGQLETFYEEAVNNGTVDELKDTLHGIVELWKDLLGQAKNKAVRAALHQAFPYMVSESVVTPSWCYCGECGNQKYALLDLILYPEVDTLRFNLGAFPTGECICE